MSIWGHRVSVKLVALVAALLVVGGFVTAMSRIPDHEMTLVARGMAFYLEGDLETPNPTIRLRAGERVRIVLRNEERGITHDFAVPVWNEGVGLIGWNEQESVTFDVPDAPGRYEYVCRPHMLMMRGVILVEDAG